MDLAQSVPVARHTSSNDVSGNATIPSNFSACPFHFDPSCENCQWVYEGTSQIRDIGPDFSGLATFEAYSYVPVAETFNTGNGDDFLDQNYTLPQNLPSDPYSILDPSFTSENIQWNFQNIFQTTPNGFNTVWGSSMMLEPGTGPLECVAPNHNMTDNLQSHELNPFPSANTALQVFGFGPNNSSDPPNPESKLAWLWAALNISNCS
jgi:hypothetical protein